MRDPYENILIGTFLYSLGIIFGRRFPKAVPPGIVNLLQQTPLDGPLADVHLNYPGIVRLIEFKRVSNSSNKEREKRTTLEHLIADKPDLQEVSRTVHWYIETREALVDWSTRITPYLDFGSMANGKSSLIEFTTSIAEAVACVQSKERDKAECDPEKVQLYLNLLATTCGKDSSSSGALVMVGKDGALRYIALENVRDLRLELSVHRSNAEELSQQVQAQRAMDSGLIDRSREQSYEP